MHLESGRVFVAHTANGTVAIIDGVQQRHLATVPGCRGASGVLCAEEDGLVFAAARGAGRVVVIDVRSGTVTRELMVGPRPNGLAWSSIRRRLPVADVEDLTARIIDPTTGNLLQVAGLPGRPRWAAYDADRDRFLLNIREPASVLLLTGHGVEKMESWPVSAIGPHGLDFDVAGGKVFVACDGATVVTLDLGTGREMGTTPITGEPDVAWFNPARNGSTWRSATLASSRRSIRVSSRQLRS